MAEWDKERQQEDQLKVDLEKVSQERDTAINSIEQVKSQYETASEQNSELASQLEETQAKIKELEDKGRLEKVADIELPEIDLENADVKDIHKQNEFLMDQIKQDRQKIERLSMLAEDFQQKEQVAQQDQARNDAKEDVLKRLDVKYGPKHRNDAVKLAEKWCYEDKTETVPGDKLEAHLLMEKAYTEVSKEVVPKKDVQSDTGRANVPFNTDDELGEGDMNSILAGMKKKGTFAGSKIPEI